MSDPTGWLVSGLRYSEDPVFWDQVDLQDFLVGRLDDCDPGLRDVWVTPLYKGEPVDAAEWQAAHRIEPEEAE